MKRELVTTDAFEKKKSHVAWFTLVLIAIILAFDGTPIKFPGIDSSIPALPAVGIIALALTYMLLTFWLESRKVIRLNSKFVAGKEIDDTVAEISRSLDQALEYLDEVSKFSFGPVPVPNMKDTIDDYKNRAQSYLDHLLELQNTEGGLETFGGVSNFRTSGAVQLDNLIKIQEAFLERLGRFPFDEVDPVFAAVEGQRKLDEKIQGFRGDLDTEIKILSADLKRLSDDILTEGKFQWGIERWPPVFAGGLAVGLAVAILIWPEEYVGLRASMITSPTRQLDGLAPNQVPESKTPHSAAGR